MDEKQSTASDVANAYRVLLGRPAENDWVCESQSGAPVKSLIDSFWRSEEFGALLSNLREGIETGGRFAGAPLPREIRWIADDFPLETGSRDRLADIRSWPELYRLLLRDGDMADLLAIMDLGWTSKELLLLLARWSQVFPASENVEGGVDWSVDGDDARDIDVIAPLPPDFDPEIYGRYTDVKDSRLGLAGHYRRIGFRQGRVFNDTMYDYRRNVFSNTIDIDLYTTQRPGINPADVVDDWIFHGSISGLQPVRDFSSAYYGALYNDLVDLNIDLYEHYIVHGRGEGRVASFDVDSFLQEGGKPLNMLAPTIVFATHEASRTGAPILALALIRHFARTHNVVLLVPKGGELMGDFVNECVLYGVGYLNIMDGKAVLKVLRDQFLAEAIIINSVGTNYMAGPALLSDLPSVGLIHEFASYTKPVTQMIRMVEQLDVAVTPAALIADQIQGEARIYRGGTTSNIVVRPQGYIVPERVKRSPRDMTAETIRNALNIAPGETPAIVLGGGTVQMRKGVDLFVQTAAEVKRTSPRPVKFLWAGHGYDPEGDLTYSMYVDYMIEALDLRQDIFFAQPQEQFDLMINLADVFFVSSRQDPFPNVALDAFAADKPVVCFERATGIAEAIRTHGFAGGTAPFCDVAAAAREINRCLAEGPVGGRNRAIIDEKFRFGDYAEAILTYLNHAKDNAATRVAMVKEIEAGTCFDASYHEGRTIRWRDERADAIRYYVARAQKGLLWRNPRPGLNEGAVQASAHKPGVPALLGRPVSEGAACPATHLSINLDRRREPRGMPTLKVALHLHLHYPDIAFELAKLCESVKMKADIVITATSSVGEVDCNYAFRDYRGGEVVVVKVDNVGRDITPFLREMPRLLDLDGYDVIGHLHGKRSSVLPEMGDRWRRFLFDALIGDRATYGKIIDLFADRSSLGMVFAEDSHSVGWGENLPYAEEVAARLMPRPTIPAYPIFPIGTMFWARPAALKSVFAARDLLAGLPGEPLPYDGTILHAFERLLPPIVEASGFDWLTVHRSGKGW